MVGKEINKLKASKAIYRNDILNRLIKGSSNVFTTFIYSNYNKSFQAGYFLEDLFSTEAILEKKSYSCLYKEKAYR